MGTLLADTVDWEERRAAEEAKAAQQKKKHEEWLAAGAKKNAEILERYKDTPFTRQETPLNPYEGLDDWDKQLQHLALGWINRGEESTPGSDWRKALRNIFGNASYLQWEALAAAYGGVLGGDFQARAMKGVDPSLYYNPDHFFSSFEKLMTPEQFQAFYEKFRDRIYKDYGYYTDSTSKGLEPGGRWTQLYYRAPADSPNPWLTLDTD